MGRLIQDGARGLPGSWQDIIENALDSCISPVALARLDGLLVYVNKAFLDLWDFRGADGLAAKPMPDLWEDRERCLQALDAVRDGHSWVGELSARRSDGSVFHAHASLSMVTDPSGAPLCVMGSFVDITDRKRAERRLSEALDLNLKTLSSALLAVIVYRADTGRCVLSNQAAGQAIGATVEQVQAQNFRTIPSWRESGLLPAAEAVLASGRDHRQLFHFTTTFNKEVWLDCLLARFESGGEQHLLLMFDNATERYKAEQELKRAEDELKRSEGRLRSILSSMADLVFVLDKEGRFTGGFHAGGDIPLLRPPADFIGKPWSEVMPPELHPALSGAFSGAREGRTANVEYSLPFGSEVRWFSANISPMYAGAELAGSVVVARDITERKRAEDALRTSEERYRQLIEQSAEGIFLLDGDGRFLLANSQACRLLGYTQEELLRLSILDTYPPGLEREGRERLARVGGGETLRFERLAKRGDGTVFPMEVSTVRLDNGRQQAVVRDITERRRAEEERRANERFLQSIFDGLQDGLSVLDTDLNIIRVNSWMERLYARSGRLVGKKCYQAYHLGESPCQRCPSIRAMKSGKTEVEVVLGPSEGGRPRWVSLSSHPWRDKDGRIIGVIEHVKDITEAKEAEERQVELARRWQATFDAIGDAVALLDPEGRIVQSNSAMADMLGMPGRDLAGRNCWEVWFGSPVPVPGCPFERMRRSRRRESEVFSLEGRWFDMVVDPVLDGSGRLLGAVHIASEVTERVKAEAALVQAQKLASVGQLAAGVAHEINNPLAALSGEIQLLSKKTKSKAVARSLKFMDKVSKRIAAIVSQLLTFSREAPSRTKEAAGINGVVESALALVERRLDQGGVRVIRRLAKGLPGLVLNRGQMEQVILNVLSNSLDAMPGGGRIVVTTREAGEGARSGAGAVEVVIEDTGTGIPKDHLGRVFDPFFTTKPPGKGVGLGLSVSHGIVLSHGGRIDVSSEPGEGTRVTIALPVAARGAERS